MATAVSLICEGGFDYLELFDEGESIGQIVMKLESKFGKAWHTLEVVRVKSTEVNTSELRMTLDQSIAKAEQSLCEGHH